MNDKGKNNGIHQGEWDDAFGGADAFLTDRFNVDMNDKGKNNLIHQS